MTQLTYPYTYPITYPILKTHDFFDKSVLTRIVIPGKVTIKSHPLQAESYTGSAKDADYDNYSDETKIEETITMRLASNTEAGNIATARLRSHQLGASRGQGSMPLLNCGQEIYDYIKMTDSRAGDTTTGIVLAFDEHIAPGKFDMTLSFGPEIKSFVPLATYETPTDRPLSAEVTTENIVALWKAYNILVEEILPNMLEHVVANYRQTVANTDSVFYDTHEVPMFVVDAATALTTGDGKFYFAVPLGLDGTALFDIEATVITKSSSGVVTISLEWSGNDGDTWADMLSTDITIDENEYRSEYAATAPVINSTYSTVYAADWIRVNIDTVGTGTKGLIIRARFAKV